MSSGAPALSFIACRKRFVPEEATVPRFVSTSPAVMPMPLSVTASVPAPLFGTSWMR